MQSVRSIQCWPIVIVTSLKIVGFEYPTILLHLFEKADIDLAFGEKTDLAKGVDEYRCRDR